MKRKGDIRIVLFPDEQSNPRNYSIKWKTVYILTGILVFLVVFFLWESITYFKMAKIAFEYNKLKSEYNVLLTQLEKVNELEQKFQQLKQYEQKLRSLLGTYLSLVPGDTTNAKMIWKASDHISTIFENIPSFTPVNGYISREFEPQTHPAIDIAASSGTPVKAVAGGRVIFSGWNQKYGNVVIIYHGNGYFSIYKHNLRNLVVDNQIIKKGQMIATVGETGELTSGPHLHLEIWQENMPLNPLVFLTLKKN
jgi:murein DD-endopeptidase MepM/ murein hydrolase activator NlpD